MTADITETRVTRDPFGATRGERAKKAKCVVWDLDNTLWDGVLLEDGNVRLRHDVVDIIRALDQRGILNSIASRNDRAAALDKLAEFGLSDLFLYPQVSWNSKSAAVATVAKQLNIGIDTLAFVDDQPFELAEVAFEHPEVICIPVDRVGELLDQPAFTPTFVTNESRVRREMYRSAIQRDAAEQDFIGDNRDFLGTLGMVLRIDRAGEQDLQRAEELTVRTNQLNSTGVTYSYAELDEFRTSPDHLLLVAGLDDRFGSYGTIGLALIETEQPIWQLKLLLMSCRVMSRGVGGVLLNEILRLASRHATGLTAEFAETGRNRTMYVTYRFAGFTEVGRVGETATLQADLARVVDVPDHLTLIMPDPLP